MSINAIKASYELSLGIRPGLVFIDTSGDALADVMETGYLNGQTIEITGFIGVPNIEFSELMNVVINTTDSKVVTLQVEIDGEDINLIELA